MENEPGLSNSSSTSSVSIISVDSKKSRISGTGFGRIGRKKDSIRKHFYEITKGTKTILKCQVCENEDNQNSGIVYTVHPCPQNHVLRGLLLLARSIFF
ncbi:uncharacterized protein LOC120356871 isoform X2 [Solenopsis invicta]|uniref:uncharacterized protein LOC120356871 isoform X2 n=1 Tax=Solenopsis invicta TaxID=13686 RepID=UPI00193E2ACE|nr:uncharacterized protein LOC120356871 isoform X2 [Solenopsis invicta]